MTPRPSHIRCDLGDETLRRAAGRDRRRQISSVPGCSTPAGCCASRRGRVRIRQRRGRRRSRPICAEPGRHRLETDARTSKNASATAPGHFMIWARSATAALQLWRCAHGRLSRRCGEPATRRPSPHGPEYWGDSVVATICATAASSISPIASRRSGADAADEDRNPHPDFPARALERAMEILATNRRTFSTTTSRPCHLTATCARARLPVVLSCCRSSGSSISCADRTGSCGAGREMEQVQATRRDLRAHDVECPIGRTAAESDHNPVRRYGADEFNRLSFTA